MQVWVYDGQWCRCMELWNTPPHKVSTLIFLEFSHIVKAIYQNCQFYTGIAY